MRLAGPQVSRADTYLFDCRGCAALFGVEINEVDVYGYIKSQSYVLSCDALSQTYGCVQINYLMLVASLLLIFNTVLIPTT